MKKLFLVCLILSSLQIFAQDQDEDLPDRSHKHSKSYLTFELISILNTSEPRYRFGYIRRLNDRWAVSLDLGYGNDNIAITEDEFYSDYSLFEIRPEVYHVINIGRKVQQYISAELFYIHHKETILNGRYEPEGQFGSIRFSSADYFRQKYGLHLKYGTFINFTNRLGLNAYAGIGVRTRDNKYSNVIDATDGTVPFPFIIFDFGQDLNYRRQEGLVGGASFDLGFKLFYRLD